MTLYEKEKATSRWQSVDEGKYKKEGAKKKKIKYMFRKKKGKKTWGREYGSGWFTLASHSLLQRAHPSKPCVMLS